MSVPALNFAAYPTPRQSLGPLLSLASYASARGNGYPPLSPRTPMNAGSGSVLAPISFAARSPSPTSTFTAAIPSPLPQGVQQELHDWRKVDMHLESEFVKKSKSLSPLDHVLQNSIQRDNKEKDAAANISAPDIQSFVGAQDRWVQVVLSEQLPEDYTGPKLTWPLASNVLADLVTHFKADSEVPLHRKFCVEIILAARDLFKAANLRVTDIKITSEKHQQLIVVGDLHGQLSDLLLILDQFGFPGPERYQVLFNGDFIDRGKNGMEVLLLILVLKLLYPKSVHLNRGNHEDSNVSREYGFANEIRRKYGIDGFLFELCMEVFQWIPVASVIDSFVFVAHGGIPRQDGILIDHIRALPVPPDCVCSPETAEDCVIVDLMWSDPSENPGIGYSKRGPTNYEFGPDITKKFLENNKLGMVIRSHEVPTSLRGYEMVQNGQVITVFSASNYAGRGGNQGAVAIFFPNRSYQFFEYMAPPLDQFEEMRSGHLKLHLPEMQSRAVRRASLDVARHILAAVLERKLQFLWYLKRYDPTGTGLVTVDQWKRAMSSILDFSIPWEKYFESLIQISIDSLQYGSVVTTKINYFDFVEQVTIECDPKYKQWQSVVKRKIHDTLVNSDFSLEEIRTFLDQNKDGKVDANELLDIANKLKLGLTSAQVKELLRGIGGNKNQDESVDVITFVESLQTLRSFSDESVGEAIENISNQLAICGESLLESFKRFDLNGDGKLQYDEITSAVEGLLGKVAVDGSETKDLVDKIIIAMDENKSGSVNYMEFVDALKKTSGEKDGVQNVIQHICRTLHSFKFSLERAFNLMDENKDGYLSPDEFAKGLRGLNLLIKESSKLSDSEIDMIAAHIDVNGDDKIAWNEFLDAFHIEATSASVPPSPARPVSSDIPLSVSLSSTSKLRALSSAPAAPPKELFVPTYPLTKELNVSPLIRAATVEAHQNFQYVLQHPTYTPRMVEVPLPNSATTSRPLVLPKQLQQQQYQQNQVLQQQQHAQYEVAASSNLPAFYHTQSMPLHPLVQRHSFPLPSGYQSWTSTSGRPSDIW